MQLFRRRERPTDRLVEATQAIDSLQCTRVLRFMGNVMERPNQMRCIPGQSIVASGSTVSIVESQLNLHKRKTCEWSRYLGSSVVVAILPNLGTLVLGRAPPAAATNIHCIMCMIGQCPTVLTTATIILLCICM